MTKRLPLFCFLLFAVVGCAAQKVRPVTPLSGSFVNEPTVAESAMPAVDGGAKQQLLGAEKEPLVETIRQDESQTGAAAVPADSAVEAERVPMLQSVPFVNQRLMAYADKQSSWDSLAAEVAELGLSYRMPLRWDECHAMIRGMFSRYSVLLEALLPRDQSVPAADFVADPGLLCQEDIVFLEGECDQVFIAGASLLGGGENQHAEEVKGGEAIVSQYVNSGRNEDAIAAFEDLRVSRPGLVVSAETRKMYGLALLRTGKFAMAAEVLVETLENMRPSREERSLRRLVGDLLLASGSFAEARGHYRRLADYFESRKGDDRWVADQLALLGGVHVNSREFSLYLDVLKGYISFDGRHIPRGMREVVARLEGDFRESPLSDQARRMLSLLEDSIREWVAARLDEVDVLMANNDYVHGKALLEQMLFDDFPLPVHDSVQRAMDNLSQAETTYREEQRVMLAKSLSAQWDRAVWLLGSEKYDEAIEVFGKLFNTEYDVPARANIQKASEAASVEMRRKSANIFVKARKEEDYDRKRELLRESWQLLHAITTRYPEVRIIDKVRQNLAIIEKHIEDFDPLILQGLQAAPN